MNKLVFEEVTENELFADYTADCSGGRSDCCTRVCTRQCNDAFEPATEEEWGKISIGNDNDFLLSAKMHYGKQDTV